MSISEYTIDELIITLQAAAGESTGVTLHGDILDVSFDELGYDSLALLETAARISRERGIMLPDSTVTDADTPRALLATVNERVAAQGRGQK